MRAIYAIWRMLARRGLATWRLTATLALGVLVAATLLAAAPVYARAMADLGLTFAIRDRLQTAPATQVQFQNLAAASTEGHAYQEAIARRADERLGWFTGERARVAQGPRFPIEGGAREPGARVPLAVPWTVSDAATHVRVRQGRLPASGGDSGRVLEIALSPKAAEAGGLKAGDRITLVEGFDDCERELPREDRPPPPPCTPKLGVRFRFEAVVSGIVEPIDPEEPFWLQQAANLFDPYSLIPDAGPLLPALTGEDAFFQVLGGILPEYRATFAWNYFADPAKLSRNNFERARADILDLREDLRPLGGFAFSPLEGALQGFRRELSFQEAPLLVLLLQIAGIALFYVAVIAALVVERQADEIALLRSRGAGRLQVVSLYLLEGLLIGVPATLLAPFLAAGATALLGLTPAFRRVTGGDPLPAHLDAGAFLLAALGAGLSLLMLIVPAFLAAHTTGVTARRQAARPRQAFFLRYYLDVAVVVLAGVLLWELSERGSVFKPGATGGLSSDPLLLASPALLTLGAAALVLRFYPLVLRIAAAAFSPVAGTAVALGLWQVVRNPGGYTRLALLLMMAVAVGTFAASYSSTAERSFRDRASFEAGADLRVSVADAGANTDAELTAALAAFPGVERSSPVLRTTVTPATPGVSRGDVVLLGLDPDAAAGLLWFRDDLADETLPQLMDRLRGPAPKGRPLPGAPVAVTVWVNPAEPRENVTMWARVRDARGTTTMTELGKLDFSGWRQLRGRLDGPYDPKLTPPLTLVSVLFSEPSNIQITSPAPVYIDDIAVEGPEGATVVEDFEGTVRWEAAPARAPARGPSIQDDFKVTGEQRHDGASAGRFQFRPGVSSGLRGIFARELVAPLPVVANAAFLAATGARVGQTVLLQTGDALTPVIVRGVARLFPTVPAGTPFVLANRDQLSAWLAAFSDGQLRRVNEAWVSLRPDADRKSTRQAMAASADRLVTLADRQEALRDVNASPLIAAGGSGILLAASLAVFALVAAALLVTIVAAVQRRRTEFAVLRAMGVSRGQLFRLLAFEYALVAALGIGVGVYLGERVARRMLSFLEVTETGASVVPPFILQTNWAMVAVAAGVIVLTFLVGMVASTMAVLRQASGQALRGTE